MDEDQKMTDVTKALSTLKIQKVADTDKVLFGIQDDKNPAVFKFVKAKAFEAHIGRRLEAKDFGPNSDLVVSVEGGRGAGGQPNRASPGLLYHTFKGEAEKLAKKKGDVWKEQSTLTAKRFYDLGLPMVPKINSAPVKTTTDGEGNVKHHYELSGDERLHPTKFGDRQFMYKHAEGVTPQAVGKGHPDEMVFMKDGSVHGQFRQKGDGLSELSFDKRFGKGTGVKDVYFTSQSGMQQHASNVTAEGKSLQKRMDSYLADVDHSRKLDKVMIELGNDYWPARQVLKHGANPEFADDVKDHVSRLQHGPNAEPPAGATQPLSVIVRDGNHIYPIETFSRNNPEKLSAIMSDIESSLKKSGHSVELHKGSWDYDDSYKHIQSAAASLSSAYVVKKSGEGTTRLVPATDVVTENFDKAYPPAKRLAMKVNKNGLPTGVMENMAVMDPKDISDRVKAELKEARENQSGLATSIESVPKIKEEEVERSADPGTSSKRIKREFDPRPRDDQLGVA